MSISERAAVAATESSNLTISVEEAAPLLGVGRDAAYAAARAREIPVIQCGRNLRVPLGALLKHINGERAGADVDALADEIEARALCNELMQLDARRAVIAERIAFLDSKTAERTKSKRAA